MEPATAAGVGGPGPGPGYPESTESSPRSRGGDSWDEPFPSSAAAAAAAAAGGRLRLMCSFGGRIVPRPTDKTLCYLGGETRIVAVDRHASLADLHARLSRSLLGGLPFTLKYQLPNEDLDSLISVSTDEDLDNLIDEYDRIAAAAPTPATGSSRTSRIRLFLFPAKPESSSSLGSLLDDSSKSENWFVDALNSAISGSLDGIPRGISTDSASVNCLLGLEDDSSVHSRSGVPNSAPTEDQRANQQKLPAATAASAASAAGGRHPHDVQSVPDSPMMDKNSSFGSTSSAPSLSNLPPIRVRQEDRPPGPPAAVEDHFAQMGISDQQVPPAAVAYMQPPPQMPVPAMAAVPVAATMSPSEASGRLFSDDDNKSDHGGVARKPLPPKQEAPPVADPSNRGVYYNDRSPPGSEVRRDMPVGTDASSYRIPVSAPEAVVAAAAGTVASQPPAGYIYAQMHAPPPQQQQPPPPQQQPPPPQPQQQQQQQQQPAPQQFVTAGNQHFIHNPATGTFIPIQTYYNHPVPQQAPPQPVLQPQQQPAFDPNTGMYYIPMRQNAPHQQYSMPPGAQVTLPPPSLGDTAPKPTVPIPQVAVNSADLQQPVYRTAAAAAPAPAPNAAPGYYHHVIQSQHHHPVQQPVGNMQGNFGYEYADPSRGQVYYSQAAAPPTLPPQYHQPMVAPDAGQADIKQNRAS